MEIENPIVIDDLWRDQEQEPEIISVCMGCREPIVEGEDMLDFFNLNGEEVQIHEDGTCALEYMKFVSIRKTAGQ